MNGGWNEARDGRVSSGYGGRFYGVYPALVTDLADPEGLGRVQIRLPWSPDTEGEDYLAWARIATLMAGGNRGTWFVPDVDDEVLVSFEAGDPRRPFVIGALWNGQDAPPESMDGAGENTTKSVTSRNGVKITIDDSDGQESLKLETPGGQVLEMTDSPMGVEIRDSAGNSVTLEPAGITISAAAKITVNGSTMEVNASMVTVNAGMASFSGVVQCNTLIATSVVGTTYTPGAGNIW